MASEEGRVSGAGDRHAQVKRAFLAALELDLAERARYLEEVCGEDAALRLEVEELLLAHVSSDDFLKTPVLGEERSLMELLGEDLEVLEVPEQVGEYQVLERLGAGGMGVVYLARQKSPRREVALKVIRAGVSSPRALRRFEYEAELLGRLSHDGIAKIFEAGTAVAGEELVPFFAMERVVGSDLVEYAEAQGLPVEERMQLLVEVARAVHHAHQKGVVHRDLKPANILVTDEGLPKVLDFGVARATDGDLSAAQPETAADQLIGTLAYMSPEQAAGDTDKLDARADVYSLGVIAFQLLTGELPHDLKGMSIAEAARSISELSPRRLKGSRPDLPVDLDLIVGVALEPDPTRRYPSADALAGDLERWLRHEPVAARPASAGYLLNRFVRRHRVGVGAALVAALGLFGWSYGMWKAKAEEHKAELAQRAAESEAQGAREMFEIWLETFEGQAPGEGVTVPMLKRLEETVSGLEERYAERPELAGELHLTIGYTLLRFGDFERALDRIRRGAEAYALAFGEDHEQTLNARANMASAYAGMRDADSAVTLLRDVRARALTSLGEDHQVSRFALSRLGAMLAVAGQLAEARVITEESLRELRGSLGDSDLKTLSARFTLGGLLRREGELDEAMGHIEAVVEAFQDEELFKRQPSLKWSAMGEQARIMSDLGRPAEALSVHSALVEEQARQYGSRDHPTVLVSREEVAKLKADMGSHEEAILELRSLRELSARTRGEWHPETTRLGHSLARLLFLSGIDDAEGEGILRGILDHVAESAGAPRVDHVEHNLLLGRHLIRKERYQEARSRVAAALELAAQLFPDGSKAYQRVQRHMDMVNEALGGVED